jgi:putative DNA primase/helicase
MESFAEDSVTPVTQPQNSDNSVVTFPKIPLYANDEKFGESDNTPVTQTSAGDKVAKVDPDEVAQFLNRPLVECEVEGLQGSAPNTEASDPRYSDAGNAQRLAEACGKDIVYVVEADEYFVWDDHRWARDIGNVQMLRMAKAVTEQMFEDAKTLPEEECSALRRFALKSQDSARMKAMVSLTKMYVRNVHYCEFDRNAMLFNAANGTIDLTSGKLIQPRRADLITVMSPVFFDPTAVFEPWDVYLMDWMQGDREKVKYLQRLCGYILTGMTVEEIMAIFHGTGRNGKTKFYKTIFNVLGDDCYAKAANFDSFVVTKGDPGMPNDVAGWRGKRLIVSSEGEKSKRLAEAKIKLLTGGDPVVGEFKYQEEFNYVPTYKIWLVTNYKPRIVGTDEAVWSRVHFVGWNRFYQSSERDPKLQEKLDSNLPAILNWMVQGCLEWQKQGLNPPASMVEDMDKYRKEQDTIGRFVEDEFIISDEHRTPKREAYNCYKRWAEDAGEHYVLTQAEFNEKMLERFQEGRSSGSRFWKGFRLKHEVDETIARLGTSYSELEKAIQ